MTFSQKLRLYVGNKRSLQVTFSTRTSAFSDRERYPNTYQVNFVARELNAVKLKLMKLFGWQRCATLTTYSDIYVSVRMAYSHLTYLRRTSSLEIDLSCRALLSDLYFDNSNELSFIAI